MVSDAADRLHLSDNSGWPRHERDGVPNDPTAQMPDEVPEAASVVEVGDASAAEPRSAIQRCHEPLAALRLPHANNAGEENNSAGNSKFRIRTSYGR